MNRLLIAHLFCLRTVPNWSKHDGSRPATAPYNKRMHATLGRKEHT